MNKRLLYSIRLSLVVVMFVAALIGAPAQARSIPAAPSNLPDKVPALPAAVTIELCASTGSATMPDATAVPIWGFSVWNGSACDPAVVPGPVIDVNEGDTVTIILHNELTENVSILFPGQDLVTPSLPDTTGASPSATTSYQFNATSPGTFLYEAGTNTAVQVQMGLYGALIVRSATTGQAYDDAGSAYDVEAVLVLSEFDPALNTAISSGTYGVSPAAPTLLDYAPRYFLINGAAYPDTAKVNAGAGQRVLLRYLNAGLMHHTMALLGAHQRIIAKDGYFSGTPYAAVSEIVAAGQTIDAIVTVPAVAAGQLLPIYNRNLSVLNNGVFPGGMLTAIEVAP